jgi:LacI family transcriptional regulator, repressor for deo operon, udp, cdd, tsx, nupC, and nupG
MKRRRTSKGIPSAQPTMSDVARRAGVSTATVSRAISQPERVSPQFRRRIQKVVRELGYTINVSARSLRRNDTGMILVVVPDIGNPFFSKLLKGIEHEARKFSYSILIGDTEHAAARVEIYARQLDARRADGLILLNGRTPHFQGFRVTSDVAAQLALPQYPIVVVSERIPGSRLPTVGIDNVAAAKEAVLHLADLGHRRIAHIAGPKGNILTNERRRGYRAALTARGLTADPDLLVFGDFSIASGRRSARALLLNPTPPTAIFCANDEMAMGAIAEIKASGRSVPRDVSVVGFDDIEFAEIFDPPLTTVRQPRFDMGQLAMSLIGKALRGECLPAEETTLESEFIIRASTSGAPADKPPAPNRRAGHGKSVVPPRTVAKRPDCPGR